MFERGEELLARDLSKLHARSEGQHGHELAAVDFPGRQGRADAAAVGDGGHGALRAPIVKHGVGEEHGLEALAPAAGIIASGQGKGLERGYLLGREFRELRLVLLHDGADFRI